MAANYQLYLMAVPALIVVILFAYVPMYGVQIAFREYRASLGIWGSQWVGLKYFSQYITQYQFLTILTNTIRLSLYGLVAGFPMPIILALMLFQMKEGRFRKSVQTITYMPHFISTVVMVGIIQIFFQPSTGLYGHLMRAIGIAHPVNLMGRESTFRTLYVFTDIWQHTGWDSIIYLAALSGVNPDLYEAATVDGASRFQRIWHIDIPSLLPTATILLILRVGSILGVGFEKVFLMQNGLNLGVSEIISTYVYKIGIQSGQFSYSTAIGLSNSIVCFLMLVGVIAASKKLSETSLW
jgi:putative aldouronate transport system permease protein